MSTRPLPSPLCSWILPLTPEPKHQGLSMLPMSKVLISLLDWLLCLFQEWREETQTIQPPIKYVTQLERKKVKVLVTQSCLTLCDTMDCSPPGSSVHGILQARILEWVAISFSRGSSQPRDWTQVSCIAGRRFTDWATRQERRSPYVQVYGGSPFFVWHPLLPHLSAYYSSGKHTYWTLRAKELELWLVLWGINPGSFRHHSL